MSRFEIKKEYTPHGDQIVEVFIDGEHELTMLGVGDTDTQLIAIALDEKGKRSKK